MKNTFQHAETSGSARRAVADHQAPHSIAYAAVPALQKKSPEDEELQMKAAVQLKSLEEEPFLQKKEDATPQAANKTGMPDQLKAGIENLSGIVMDDVKVHYNSDKPAQLNALAYAQGTNIHIAPGRERHLPHEAWHVVQQKQGRVRPTIQAKGVVINDDKGLEKEADVMGERALQRQEIKSGLVLNLDSRPEAIAQRKLQLDVNNSQRVAQLEGGGWGEWMSHYWSKKDELGHVLTSGRRQFMQRTSAAAKSEREEEGTESIRLDKIRLLHWTEHGEGSKTAERRNRLVSYFSSNDIDKNLSGDIELTESLIGEIMKSKDLVQVAHEEGNNEVYVTLEGVGRLLAIRTACAEKEIPYNNVKVAVKKYTVTKNTMESLLGVHESYFEEPESNEELEEDLWSHLYGVGRSLGWTVVGLGTVAALIVGGKKLLGENVPPIQTEIELTG